VPLFLVMDELRTMNAAAQPALARESERLAAIAGQLARRGQGYFALVNVVCECTSLRGINLQAKRVKRLTETPYGH